MSAAPEPAKEKAKPRDLPSPNVGADLDRVRDILFGEQIGRVEAVLARTEGSLEQQIADLRAEMVQRHEELRADMVQRHEELRADLLRQHKELTARIEGVDRDGSTALAGARAALEQRCDELAKTGADSTAAVRQASMDRETLASLLTAMARQVSDGTDEAAG